MFRRNKLFFWTTEILLITLIFYLWREMGTIITPFVSVVNTIMIPFLLGGFLYYLTNPIVIFLEKECRINRIIGILLTLCVLFGTIVIAVVYLVTNSVGSVLSALVSTVLIIIMTPVFLIYFLLDGHKFLPMLERTILKRDKLNISGLITNLNETISRYISGVSIDAFIIGCLAFIGYSVIGLKYALVFAIFSGLANLIPYVGPSIGLIPMIISNLFTDPQKMIIAVIYMLIIQQVDGNILYPRIVGGVMKVHPITILVLLLLSSNIYGVVGMIVAVPTYSILKEISKFLVRLYEKHKEVQEVGEK